MYRNVVLIFIITINLYGVSFQVLATSEPQSTSAKTAKTCNSENIILNNVTTISYNFEDKHFQQLGKAKLSVLFWDIYESTLYTSDGKLPFSSNACQQTLFEIRYLRDISKKELLENTESQWRYLNVEKATYSDYLTLLNDIWPDIQAGDQLSLLTQGSVTVFYFNQQKIAEIENRLFGELFLRIWLDENTSEPKLRQQLLGDLA